MINDMRKQINKICMSQRGKRSITRIQWFVWIRLKSNMSEWWSSIMETVQGQILYQVRNCDERSTIIFNRLVAWYFCLFSPIAFYFLLLLEFFFDGIIPVFSFLFIICSLGFFNVFWSLLAFENSLSFLLAVILRKRNFLGTKS